MTDFAALSAAQPPLPMSATLDVGLHNLIFSGRANGQLGSIPLPNFSDATLQFLRKLSPHLQKAALTAILNPKNQKSAQKSQKPKFQSPTTTEFTTITEPTTPPTTTTTTTTTETTTSVTTPFTTTTSAATSTTRRFRRKPRKPSTAFTKPTTTVPFRTPPSFHWTDDNAAVPGMSWESALNKEAQYNNNALQEVDRIGIPSSISSSDAGIVLLVAIFNLLAVVIYAAHRHVTNIPSLPARVLDWQIQKVLDELVLRVHSSRGAAQLLARALPTDLAASGFTGRSVQGFTSENGLKVLDKAKSLLLDVAASPTASNMARLPMGLYRPLTQIYNQVMIDLKKFLADGGSFSNLDTNFEGRSLSEKDTNGYPTWLKITHGATQLNSIQWDGVLRTLTILGRSRSLASSEAIAKALMSALMTPEGTGRSLGNFNFENLTRAALVLSNSSAPNKTEESSPGFADDGQPKDALSENSPRSMRRMGYVEDASGLTGAGGELGDHWAQRWFSLVTRLAPVALDATTLYARAHSEPTCLRSLLCSINFSWKKVGPLQAALTPLLSVLTGWALEDRAPHPLGESLSAIRGGWLGRDCAALYPECSISQTPNDIVSQALTYFSRLEIAVSKNPNKSLHKEKWPPQDERQREDDQLLIYDDYDSNDIAYNEDDTVNSNRSKNNQAAPPIAKTSNNYHTRNEPEGETTTGGNRDRDVSHNNHPSSGTSWHDIDVRADMGKEHAGDDPKRHRQVIASGSSLKHRVHDRDDSENNIRVSMDGQRDRHSTTDRYDAYQSYEARNPHYDSYELYRKEAYGALVPDYEMHEAGVGETGHRGWSRGQEDLTLNHKMEENGISDLENNDRRKEIEESRSTTSWDTGYQQRSGEDSYSSSTNPRGEEPYRSPAPHRGEDSYSPSPNHRGEEQYHSPPPQRRHQIPQHPSPPPYERYDSPSVGEEEVPVKDQSVITGWDLQDAPSSHAALLVSSVEQQLAAAGLKEETSLLDADKIPHHEEPIPFINGHPPHQVKTTSRPDIRLQVYRHTPEKTASRNQQKLQYHTISRDQTNLSKKPHQAQTSPPEKRPTKYEKNPLEPRPLYKRPEGDSPESKPKQRPQYPKSRILFAQSTDHGEVAQRRKQLWHSQERPSQSHLSVEAYLDELSHLSAANTIDRSDFRVTEHRRKNSKMPAEPERTSNSLRSPSGDIVNGKLEIPLYTSYQSPNHRYEGSVSSEVNRVAVQEDSLPVLKIHAPVRERPKYKYGLRRGLPAVTVDNFTTSKTSGASTSHLSKRTRPWYSYNSSPRRAKYPHKAEAKPQPVVQIKPTASPMSSKAVAHFGPADAITDEYRNNLLFQYIRDQRKDENDSAELVTERSR